MLCLACCGLLSSFGDPAHGITDKCVLSQRLARRRPPHSSERKFPCHTHCRIYCRGGGTCQYRYPNPPTKRNRTAPNRRDHRLVPWQSCPKVSPAVSQSPVVLRIVSSRSQSCSLKGTGLIRSSMRLVSNSGPEWRTLPTIVTSRPGSGQGSSSSPRVIRTIAFGKLFTWSRRRGIVALGARIIRAVCCLLSRFTSSTQPSVSSRECSGSASSSFKR